MNEAAELLVRKLDAAAKAELPVDIHKLLGEMTMGVVGTTAFGLVPSWFCRVHVKHCTLVCAT